MTNLLTNGHVPKNLYLRCFVYDVLMSFHSGTYLRGVSGGIQCIIWGLRVFEGYPEGCPGVKGCCTEKISLPIADCFFEMHGV